MITTNLHACSQQIEIKQSYEVDGKQIKYLIIYKLNYRIERKTLYDRTLIIFKNLVVKTN